MIGTVSALSMVGVALGATVVGLVVADVGLVATLVVMGGIYLALAVVMVLNPELRAMDVLGSSRDDACGRQQRTRSGSSPGSRNVERQADRIINHQFIG